MNTRGDEMGRILKILRDALAINANYLPKSLRKIPTETESTVLQTIIMRVTLAALVVHVARQGPRHPERQRNVEYTASLFMDTHLSLLSAMHVFQRVDDSYWLSPEGEERRARISTFYPFPNNACCMEELPNFVSLLPFTDIGGDVKENKLPSAPSATGGRAPQKIKTTLKRTLAHVFITKALPRKCNVRHVASVLSDAADCYPIVTPLFRLVLYTVLSGNMRGAYNYTNLSARIRLRVAIDAMSDEELIRWADTHKKLTIFILREHFIEMCEQDGVIEEVIHRVPGFLESATLPRAKWIGYKSVVRTVMQRVREVISKSAVLERELQWDSKEIENILSSGQLLSLAANMKNSKGRPSAIIGTKMTHELQNIIGTHLAPHITEVTPLLHALVPGGDPIATLLHRDQNKKKKNGSSKKGKNKGKGGDAESSVPSLDRKPLSKEKKKQIMHTLKRIKDEELTRTISTLCKGEAPSTLALADAIVAHLLEKHISSLVSARLLHIRDALQMCAFQAMRETTSHARSESSNDRTIVPLKWLKVLGVPAPFFHDIRDLFYKYCTTHCSDAEIRKKLRALGKADIVSYCVAQTYLTLFEYYREKESSPVIFCPIGEAVAQLTALRERLGVGPHESTPPTLGVARICRWGCQCWATVVQPAPKHVIYDYDAKLIEKVCKPLTKPVVMPTPLPLPPPPTPRIIKQEEGGEENAPAPLPSDAMEESGVAAPTALSLPVKRRVAKKKKKKFCRLPGVEEGVRLLVEVGHHLAHLDVVDGLLYCARKKDAKGPARKDTKKSTAAAGKGTKDFSLTKYYNQLRNACLTLQAPDRARCGVEPLALVDLVGVWYNVNGFYYGLCCYCGNVTSVAQEKITQQGLLSCMNHWHADYHPDHAHAKIMARSPAFPGHTIPRGGGGSRTQCAYCNAIGEFNVTGVDATYSIVSKKVCARHREKLALPWKGK